MLTAAEWQGPHLWVLCSNFRYMVLEFANNLRRKCQKQFIHCDKEHPISQYYSKFLLVFSWELKVSREVYRNLKQRLLFTNYFQLSMSSLEVI